MKAKIKKWRRCAAVHISASILPGTGLTVDSHMNIEVQKGRIIIESAEQARQNLKLPFTEETLLQVLNSHTAYAEEGLHL